MQSRHLIRFLLLMLLLGAHIPTVSATSVEVLALASAHALPPLPPCPPPPATPGVPPPSIPCKRQSANTSVSPGELCLRLIADPSTTILPATIVTYQLAVHNNGDGEAKHMHITFPITPEAQELLDAKFTTPTAWVSAVLTNAIELRLEVLPLAATITATLRLRTNSAMSLDNSIVTRALLHWGEEAIHSNRVSLLVTSASASSPVATLGIVPTSGTPSTTFAFAYDGLTSHEHVSLWYHRPDGSIAALEDTKADAEGRISGNISQEGLSKGRYMLVAQGQCSQVVAMGMFMITE